MAMQLPSSSSSSSSSVSNNFIYDVFISFRGTDTRFGFTGNLYRALSDKGIHTFIDDKELKRGDEITPSLRKSIEDSRIAIIVFSKDYATSSFCLDELAHIIQHFKENGRLVLPVFYDVDPSDVRHQSGSYGEALAKHNKKSMDRFQKWKEALSKAANLSGHHIKLGTEYEYNSIEKIVKDVFNKINHIPLHVPDYLVGLEPRILEVNSLLELGSNDGVCIIGILGYGGIGKTTLARAVFNSIAKQFEGSCFLHKVRETSIAQLQEQLLSKTIGMDTSIADLSVGTQLIKERLPRKKILLILDDVDKLEQLQSFVPNMLGSGSKVIVTTRDKHLLSSHKINKIYEANGLNKEQALELLRNVAFKSKKSDSSYDSILNRAVKYASGLPLALEVVGSNLFGRSITECESLLDKYERIPHKDILKTLKVSFDTLDDDQKSVFLDIACFFKGCDLAYIKEELQSQYDHDIQIDLTVLVEKSLIKIDLEYLGKSNVRLHDLIEDMGKEIVRQESPNNPGERSRLWFHDDIVKVLEEDTGTAHIKMIYLKCSIFSTSKIVIEWNGNAFKKMTNLKSLVIENVDFSKDPEYLPSGLRVLRWQRYPWMSPSSLIWNKKFNYMKVLALNDCEFLTHIPDISGLPNLEQFSFQYCQNLITIDNSVGQLDKLEILDVWGCEKLESFPPLRLPSLKKLRLYNCESLITIDNSVWQLDKLEILYVTYCNKLVSFPPLRLPSLKELTLCNCESLITIDNSVWQLNKLEILDVSDCIKLESFPPLRLPSLKKLRLYNCESLITIDNSVWQLDKLEILYVTGCNKLVSFPPLRLPSLKELTLCNCESFITIDNSVWQLDKLEILDVSGCEKIESFPPLQLPSLKELTLKKCTSLEDECLQMLLNWCLNVTRVDFSESNLKILPECIRECHHLRKLYLDDCEFLEEIRWLPPNLEKFSAIGCYSLSSSSIRMLLSQELHEKLHEDGYKKFRLHTGTQGIPDWFEHQSRGHTTISFRFRKKIPSINVIILMESEHPLFEEVGFYVNDRRRDLPEGQFYDYGGIEKLSPNDAVLFDLKLEEVLLENEWNTVKLKLENGYFYENDDESNMEEDVEIGIHVWKENDDESNMEEDVIFTNPYSSDTEEDDDKMNSSENVVLSNVEYLDLAGGRISDECLRMLLNVTHVDLSRSNLKILPDCLRQCHLLKELYLDGCKFLEEIRGFPPNLEEFSAIGCESLNSSSIRMLLSQELHEKLLEAGYKKFRLHTGTQGIPDWFEHQSRGHTTISFRFHKKIPSINVIILRESEYSLFHDVKFYVNDCPRDLPEGKFYDYNGIEKLPPKHAVLFDLKLEEVLLENEWITVKLKLYSFFGVRYRRNVEIGIHVWNEKNNMEEDVIFTNPYDDESDDESKSLEVSETENVDEDVILNNPFSRKRKPDEDINASLQQKDLKK